MLTLVRMEPHSMPSLEEEENRVPPFMNKKPAGRVDGKASSAALKLLPLPPWSPHLGCCKLSVHQKGHEIRMWRTPGSGEGLMKPYVCPCGTFLCMGWDGSCWPLLLRRAPLFVWFYQWCACVRVGGHVNAG